VTGPTPPRPEDPTARPPGDRPDVPTGTDAPSEFLTPVQPFETIEPSPASGGGRRLPRPSTGIVAAVVAVALVAAGIVLASTAQRTSGPPGAPQDLTASAGVCAAPECERIEANVTLSWSTPEGQVDRYVVERDGEPVGRLSSSSTGFESGGLQIDRSYTFGVRAIGGGTDGPTSEVRVRTPTPPLEESQLTGTYRVRETVRRATNLSTVEGITNPTPGSSGRSTWSFAVVCADQAGACPTNWFSWGPLRNRGTHYDGTFHARPASCVGGATARTTTEMHLLVSNAHTVAGRWIADRFSGTIHVRFHCPGGRSVGILRVDGRAGAS
jgi:hypothetical protein